jgi:hypothetical protein
MTIETCVDEVCPLSVDLSRLHGVLKDKTRVKILELLNQRGSLGYVELQNLLEISSTGKLNYHLKVLGDLLVKDEPSGRYSLSEKGKVAVELGKFQTVANSKNMMRKAGWRGMSIMAGVGLPIFATLYYFLNPSSWFLAILSVVYGYILLFVFYRRWSNAAETGEAPFSIRTRRIAIIYAFALVFFFINAGLLGLGEWAFPFINSYPPYVLTLMGALPGAIIGGVVGDTWGRRRNYEPIWWPL